MEDPNSKIPDKGINHQINTKDLSFIYEIAYKNANLDLNLGEESSSDRDLEPDKGELLNNLKVLKDIEFKIEKGQFITLCGHTGCGKSTLVRTLNGLIPHFYNGLFYGFVKILGKDTINENVPELSQHVGLVFQNPENQLVAMDVEREIVYGLENRGLSRDYISQKLEDVLTYLNIAHLRKRHPYELSGGEQQRVAIASILALEPEIIILDEPTSALDPKAAKDVVKLLKKINIEKKITVIIIEHRLEMILPFCDKIILMKDGRIVENDAVEMVINSQNFINSDIQIPTYIGFFHGLKKKGIYSGNIPKDLDEASTRLEEILFN
jgi:energy-coupling factor transporter ATP-binding protein EcfA2